MHCITTASRKPRFYRPLKNIFNGLVGQAMDGLHELNNAKLLMFGGRCEFTSR